VINQYDQMVSEFNFTVIDGSQSVETQQKEVRAAVQKVLATWEGMNIPNGTPNQKTAIQTGGRHD
jgi:hypothetical protein